MKACVVICRDPFRPANHRSIDIVRRRRSLRNLAPRTCSPVICQVNGKWIPRKAWAMRITDGDSVVFVLLPQGGGGGGSSPLKAVLMIAVMVFASYAAGALNGIAGLTTLTSGGALTMTGSIIAGAIGLVGSVLVNALIPAASATAASTATSLAAASPTYTLGAQGNSARLGQPIPVLYGRHMIYPDFAAQPYVEYAGNEQYLYQLFCIGQGEYDIEAIRIEDTPISSFPEVDYEVIGPGGSVTLFPSRVITSGEVSGQEALTNVIIGPFIANDSGTLTNCLAIDIVMARGLYYANDSGGLSEVGLSWMVQVVPINDDGVIVGPWNTVGAEYMAEATTTPIRRSYRYYVASGRYQVRLMRTDEKLTDSRYGHELDWAGLRAYIPGSQAYGNVTMVAMRMRATNSLSAQASRKINFIVTRRLKVWNSTTGWSGATVATRSIAWAIADICRADYGAELADSRIGLQGLYALATTWAARGDTFNMVFDSQSTIMEALGIACRAGRAVPFMQGGVLHAVRDQPATLPVALFSQRNIVKNSFKIDYLMASEDTADAIDVTYFDEAIWSERTVRAALPGSAQATVAQMKIPGVTSRAQAWREGMYGCACNRYRRRLPTFQTEMEGFIPTLCDLIAIQHDLPSWGQSGEIVAWDPVTREAITSEPLVWTPSMQHMLAFRGRDGSVQGPYYASAGTDAYRVILDNWSASGTFWSDGVSDRATPDIGSARERSHFAFGPTDTQYIRARMISLRPRSSETVEIAAVIESDYVHFADTGVAPGVNAWQLPTKITAPTVSGLSIVSIPFKKTRMLISWQASARATHYLVEQSDGTGAWQPLADISGTSLETDCIYGPDTVVRVAAVGIVRGPWASFKYIDYLRIPPSNVDSFTIDGNVLTFSPVPDRDLDGYRIKFQYGVNAEWGTANPLHSGLLTSSPYTMLIVPPGTVTIMIRAVDTSGNESARSTYIITDLGDPLVANVLESYDFKAVSWPGSISNAAVIGFDLQANQSDPFFKSNRSDFFEENGAPFFSQNYDGMAWISTGWTPSVAARGSSMTIGWDASGEALTLEYRPTGPSPFFASDLSLFFSDDSDAFFDAPPDWMVWPGMLTAETQEYQWRVTTSPGPIIGRIAKFEVSVDVPDRVLSMAGVAIGASGTRLSDAIGKFNVIKNIQLTLESGSLAMKLEIADRSTSLGPLIYARDVENALVSAVIDATIQGY